MTTLEQAITVQEVSMQEWAMAAFHAARAPQRVRVTVKTVQPSAQREEETVRGPGHLWLLVTAAAAGLLLWYLI